mgnify:CR=1 FL=1
MSARKAKIRRKAAQRKRKLLDETQSIRLQGATFSAKLADYATSLVVAIECKPADYRSAITIPIGPKAIRTDGMSRHAIHMLVAKAWQSVAFRNAMPKLVWS